MGCRWVGRSWALASLQDRQERARSAGLQALRAARRQLQGRSPAPASRRRRCVPAKPSAAPRLPHAPTHRRGDPGGGRGRARPREGKGPVLPEQAAAAAQEAEAAAAAEAATCPPQSPAASDPRPPVRQPAPRRGALSTARGEYLPRRPPRGRPRDSPGRGRRGPPRPAPLGSTCPAWASAAVGVPGGRTGPSGLPGLRRYKGSRDSGQILSRESLSRFRASVSPCVWGATTLKFALPRGTSACRASGVDASGRTAFG